CFPATSGRAGSLYTVAWRTAMPTEPLTLEELLALEPRLKPLFAEAKSFRRNTQEGFCANAVWFGYPGYEPGLKALLAELVGWYSRQEGVLGSREAYEVASRALYKALPDCRHDDPCSPFDPLPRRRRKPGKPIGYWIRASDIPMAALAGEAD